MKRKAYPERYVLPSFIDVDATHVYKDKQGECHITMKFRGGSKEYDEKISNEDFMAFNSGNLTKEEVIAKYHKPRIESYIHKEFSRPEKRSAARRNFDDMDDMNDEERKELQNSTNFKRYLEKKHYLCNRLLTPSLLHKRMEWL